MKIFMLMTTSALMACGDFLEEHSQNLAYVEKVEDLDELLIGEAYLKGGYSIDSADADNYSYWARPVSMSQYYFPYVHLMDDDVEEYLLGELSPSMESYYTRKKASRLYSWQTNPFVDSEMNEIKDMNWTSTYRRIAALNAIIAGAMDMRPDQSDKTLVDRVEGEARFLRAQFYFWMANLYGRPYCKTTAATEDCIPLKTTEVVESGYFERETAERVYRQMETDLKLSANYLRGIPQTTKYRTCQAAAFALLSRVYLYMEEYENAVSCADSVLAKGYSLIDLNKHTPGESTVYASSTETIFTHGPNIMAVLHAPAAKYGINYISSGYSASGDLMNSYEAGDLRPQAYFINRSLTHGEGFRCVKMRFKAEEVSDIMAIRLPEVYLNKAEALAQLGRDDAARSTLLALREKRFAAGRMPAVTASGKELVKYVREERRRELCFEGHRWFDLRRYAVNTLCPQTKAIRHAVLAHDNGNVYTQAVYELKPYPEDVAAYMLPIPSYAIDFNMGHLTNEARNERNPLTL